MSVVDATLCPKAKKCGKAIGHRSKKLLAGAGMIGGNGRHVPLAQKATQTILIASGMGIGITTLIVMAGLRERCERGLAGAEPASRVLSRGPE
jgi:hypothetical protein